MENVTIVGTEDNLLILATEAGARFGLPIDEVLRAEVRRSRANGDDKAAPLAASPREIQAKIRSGLSAAEVSDLLGVDREVVERFESPVLAEREHLVSQALAVPVLIGSEVEPDAQPTFGVAIRNKLAEVSASGERWASWKDESAGWIIKLEFTANEVDHDARWSFDPRRSALAPLNADATQLSRQGSLPEGLIPRLRALDKERPSPYKDDSRFDSGAFGPRVLPPVADAEETPAEDAEPAGRERSAPSAQEAATKRAPETSQTPSGTADLLEALRRRRGQREPVPTDDAPDQGQGPIALFDALEPGYDGGIDDDAPSRSSAGGASPVAPPSSTPSGASTGGSDAEGGQRRRRREMPSWDEIVFGARTDE
ncbi:septation protein SepH [Microbacterium pseudoresistens]|uniref:DUF3071 domain-containing protein n=1 Tax=Microbacterium pseudoresistens TaxID=640634 RepID=A0A7Y9EX13_9MICO|nr:septation protein SepH [Microbacterium pseudoresistens]NYD55532.1 hypothetical protein [Microbacterium pseudoresistens]